MTPCCKKPVPLIHSIQKDRRKRKVKIERFVCGVIEENAYIIYREDGGDCYVVDPGENPGQFLSFIKEHNLKVKGILLTHHHNDHIGAVDGIIKETGCKVFIHELDLKAYGRPAEILKDGDVIELEGESLGESLKVISTPGHTRGSVCFLSESGRYAFTGDTLFAIEVGRSDLADSGRVQLALSLGNIIEKWDDDIKIYPGHGEISDIGTVKRENPDYKQAMKRYSRYYEDVKLKAAVKLIALDLDGTTLASDITLPEENRKALSEAVSMGVNVVAASGRCFNSLPSEVLGIDGVQYAISSNGAQITDLRTKEVIYSNCIDPKAVKLLHDIIVENGYDAEVFVDGCAYMEKDMWERIRDGEVTFRRREYIMKTRRPIENVLDFMLGNDYKVENVNIFFEDISVKPAIRETLKPLDEVATVTTSFDTNWEVGGLTTSKAAAIEELGIILGVTMDEVMSFGDSPNDIPMIREAGMGVAVENAKDSVKEAADFITTSNDDGGVAVAVRKFVTGV